MMKQTALFCGSRTFHETESIRAWLSLLDPYHWRIIHGGALGADFLSGFNAKMKGFEVEQFTAEWETYGKRAGYVRNQKMLDEGQPDIVLAFVDKPLIESKGTAMMVELAHRAGVPVFVTQYIAP